jgi:hypothetical protein
MRALSVFPPHNARAQSPPLNEQMATSSAATTPPPLAAPGHPLRRSGLATRVSPPSCYPPLAAYSSSGAITSVSASVPKPTRRVSNFDPTSLVLQRSVILFFARGGGSLTSDPSVDFVLSLRVGFVRGWDFGAGRRMRRRRRRAESRLSI